MGKKLLSLFLVLLMFGMIEQNEMVIKATTSFLIQDVKNTTTEDLGNGYIYETNTQKDVKGVKAYSTTTTYTKTHKIINSSTGELVLKVVQVTKWNYVYGRTVKFVSASNTITLANGYSVSSDGYYCSSPYNGICRYNKKYTLKKKSSGSVIFDDVFFTECSVYGICM